MKIGIVDTTFSRINMGAIALDELKREYPELDYERRTVPGIKDLGVECKKILKDCDICMALGMVGGAHIDTQCAHEASLGIQQAKLMTNKHIIEVFVHENEAWSSKEFMEICQNRIRKHVHNAVKLVNSPEDLMSHAGRGLRQGKNDEGPIDHDEKFMVGIVVSKFNNDITDRMAATAKAIADAEGIEVKITEVPGTFDMPLIVKKMLMDKGIKGVVTLGAVIKGETAHDEVITKICAEKIADLSLKHGKPVSLGIVGYDATREQVAARADEYAKRAMVSTLTLMKRVRE